MIQLDTILTPARTRVDVPGGSKKRVLEFAATLLAEDQPGLDPDLLFDNLVARERLGSTGFGNGIAIPHCRMSGCATPLGAILRLDGPVEFDSIDGLPVDLLFILLVPETATEEHLALLRHIASLLDNDELREALRQAPDNQSLYRLALSATPGEEPY